MRKAQVSTEMLIMAGFAIVILVPALVILLGSAGFEGEKLNLNMARMGAQKIADTAFDVYAQGDGAKKTIAVNYPENLKNVTALGNEIVFRIALGGKEQEIVAKSRVNITEKTAGELGGSLGQGLHTIALEYNSQKRVVEIEYAKLEGNE